MEAYLLALWAFFLHNPEHNEPYQIPIEYSVAAYEEAAKYSNVEPEDILSTIVAEHGGSFPYADDSEGGKGELGLMQLSKWQIKKWNKATGEARTMDELFDWRFNITIGAFAIHTMKIRHATAKSCKQKWVTVPSTEGGPLVAEKAPVEHVWQAHYRCTREARERCKTSYREILVKRFSKWKKAPMVVAVREFEENYQPLSPRLRLLAEAEEASALVSSSISGWAAGSAGSSELFASAEVKSPATILPL